jgi:hypothetical protein
VPVTEAAEDFSERVLLFILGKAVPYFGIKNKGLGLGFDGGKPVSGFPDLKLET